jgi:hypothetical protein
MTEIIRKCSAFCLAYNWPKIAITFYSLVFTLCTTRFNVQKVCILLTQSICVFRVDLTTKSDFLHVINRLIKLDGVCLLCLQHR